MKKDNLMFGVFGLIVGLVVGFVFANSVNKTAAVAAPGSPVPGSTATSLSGNPALPPDHPPLGTSSGDMGNTPGEIVPQVAAAIEKAKSEPKNFEAQMTAADLYYQIQRYEEAAQFYEAAHKLKPADAEPMIKMGNSLFDADKYTEAETWYLQALEKEPKNVNVRNDLGLTFFLRQPRDVDRAITEFKAALVLDPEYEITLQNLTLAYTEKGDTANFNQTLTKLRQVNPKNPIAVKNEGK
jgi:tetratricopeptide (TPR) repeat protein